MLIFSAVFTFFHLVIFGFYLQLSGVAMVAEEEFQSVILPSMIINLIAAIPMYLLVNELHRWVYPLAEEA
jgi:ABC-type methionine transport system permease subunit